MDYSFNFINWNCFINYLFWLLCWTKQICIRIVFKIKRKESKMKNIKLIALDMDGTLLNDEGIVTGYTKDVIQEALAQDIHVVLTTGRPLPLCYPFAEELNLSSYIISSNGAEIWTVQKELLERHSMDALLMENLWDIGIKRNHHMWVVATDKLFLDQNKPDNFYDYEWLKIGYGQLNKLEKEELLFELEKKEDQIEVTNSSLTNLEVNKGGVNKAAALKSVCKRINISMNEVLAAGDSLNDLKMIEQVGVGVAMENAQELIKQSADYITETNNNDGVAKAIERFL